MKHFEVCPFYNDPCDTQGCNGIVEQHPDCAKGVCHL